MEKKLKLSLSVKAKKPLKNVDVIIINGEKNKFFEDRLLRVNKNLDIFYSSYIPINIDKFKGKKLLALAGIGNPENFFQILEKNRLQIGEKLIFPDHYNFSMSEVKNIIERAKKNNKTKNFRKNFLLASNDIRKNFGNLSDPNTNFFDQYVSIKFISIPIKNSLRDSNR